MPSTSTRKQRPTRSRQRRTSSSGSCKRPRKVPAKSCVACKTTCINATDPLVTKTDASLPAQWLSDLERPAVPRHAHRWKVLEKQGFRRVCGAPHANLLITHTAKAGHRLPERVVYWAASGCALEESDQLRGAERAYGDYTNMGVAARTTHNGQDRLVFRIATPCAYVARARGQRVARQWCRHLHFVALEPGAGASGTWRAHADNKNELYTLPVFPCSLLEKYEGRYSCVPVHRRSANTLPSMFVGRSEYMHATHPSTGWAVGVCAIDDPHYPPVQKHDMVLNWKASETTIQRQLRQSAKVSSVHTPLIVYCAGPKCVAAQALIEKLAHLGYCNVWYFKEGMGL